MTTSEQQWAPYARTAEIADRLTRFGSVTGTAGEADITDLIIEILGEIPYFQEHPDHVAIIDSHPVAGGSKMAKNIVALVRGTGRKTLAMAGHFDVVSIENYHDLKHLAFKSDQLCDALIADLSGRAQTTDAEKLALRDLQSGDFIPGRGLLDMKSGDAAGIAFLEHFSQIGDREGNVVLFLTPDEERNSCGMRSLRNALPELAGRWELDIVGGINLDASSDPGNGEIGRAIFHGSIGKLLPFALVAGLPTHVGYPFDGVSAHAIASEIMTAIEANSDLCDSSPHETAPPPVCLEARDMRDNYEVTTPEHVWMAFNWLVMGKSCADLMADFTEIVRKAGKRALKRFELNAVNYVTANGGAVLPLMPDLRVITVAELRDMAFAAGGQEALERIDAVSTENAQENNPLNQSCLLVRALLNEAHLRGPAVVVGIAGLHYPAVLVDPNKDLDRDFMDAVHRARKTIETRHDTRICDRGYFMGISDMSFFGHAPHMDATAFIAANTPISELVDQPVADALQYPVVNIGPWGREYHQRHERLYAPYAYGVLPDFLAEIASELLSPA
ncbi:MAG: M20/M25/M40 family metallo-hydrolase [Thalassospira sp.]|uniref:M20/M25/M40 family metallo-hydrolase n=1 Tax=Thalassospira sp. TaxID=1912094 RepID=UPI003A84724F